MVRIRRIFLVCIRSIRNSLGFYADIQIFLGGSVLLKISWTLKISWHLKSPGTENLLALKIS